ncbi:MAG: hypothetical protein ACK446_01985, partial [Rhodobacterales bacterium]
SLDCQDCWPNEADGGAQARQTSAEDLLRPACRGKPFHCDDYFSGLLTRAKAPRFPACFI